MKEFYITEEEDEAGTNEGACKVTDHDAEAAVETFINHNHSHMDYPEETTLWVWADGEQPRKFEVNSELSWHHSINEVLA